MSVATASTKRCPRCGETKPLSEFGRDRSTVSGLNCYCKPCNVARHHKLLGTEYYRRYRKRWELEHRYGLTLEQFEQMIAKQGGRCAVCQREAKSLHVDHDHATGKVRGLLCHRCNRTLGLFGEDPSALRALADYVLAHQLQA